MSGNYNTSVKSKTEMAEKDYWRTPDNLKVDGLMLIGADNFGMDACAKDVGVAVCMNFISESENALTTEWDRGCFKYPIFCNPPFSLKWEFFHRAVQQVNKHKRPVLFVMPYEPASVTWRNVVDKTNCLVYEPDGRYNYLLPDGSKTKNGCNFPTALIHIVPHYTGGASYIKYERGNINR